MTNNIILSPEEIAIVTNGTWTRFPINTDITGISLETATLQKGDLYIKLGNRDANKSLKNAILRGAGGAIVDERFKLTPVDFPILRVSDSKLALKQIGAASRDKSNVKSVLVTGSFGKTGFKTQLHHAINKQFRTHAVLDSSNRLKEIWKSYGTLHSDDKITIVEVAVPRPRRGEIASNFIMPCLCVITHIGAEHLNTNGGNIDDIIANKAKIVIGMQPHSKIIIPYQKGVYTKLKNEILKHRKDIEILAFGDDNKCNAQLLHKINSTHGWKVKARIENNIIEYDIPTLENYSPLSSISVLLSVFHLGGDIYDAADRYRFYHNIRSSGNFYELINKQGNFFLYDQSVRIGIDAFRSTLQLMERIRPKNKGKKIAVFTEFFDFEEAPKEILNTSEFKALFEQSGIDCLYTANKFIEHSDVLHDKSIWRKHADNIDALINEIIENISQDDIIFIRAKWDSGADKLADIILNNSKIIRMIC